MTSPFVAEIRIFSGGFAPKAWALCDGQILPISQNTALFSLLGTNYGGDGKSNFALPNLQGNTPMHTDQFSGNGDFPIGVSSGVPNVTLLESEIPVHAHTAEAAILPSSLKTPDPTYSLSRSNGGNVYLSGASNFVQMSPNALAPAGGSLPHNNMQPYLVMTFIIALQGVFPPRG